MLIGCYVNWSYYKSLNGGGPKWCYLGGTQHNVHSLMLKLVESLQIACLSNNMFQNLNNVAQHSGGAYFLNKNVLNMGQVMTQTCSNVFKRLITYFTISNSM